MMRDMLNCLFVEAVGVTEFSNKIDWDGQALYLEAATDVGPVTCKVPRCRRRSRVFSSFRAGYHGAALYLLAGSKSIVVPKRHAKSAKNAVGDANRADAKTSIWRSTLLRWLRRAVEILTLRPSRQREGQAGRGD